MRTTRLNDEAQRRMIAVRDEMTDRINIEDRVLSGSPPLVAWGAKSAGRVARRALHLHMAEHGPKGAGLLITRETIKRSLRIENWFAENIKRVFDVVSTENADRRTVAVSTENADRRTVAVSADDAKTMARWLAREEAEHPGEPVLVKEITNRGPKALRRASTQDAVIETLAQTYCAVRQRR